jgi:hypothetical protein
MKIPHNCKGIAEPITLIIIVACLCVGGYFALRSQIIDSPAEQTAEAILRREGIDVDFSAEKKKDANVPQIPCTPD